MVLGKSGLGERMRRGGDLVSGFGVYGLEVVKAYGLWVWCRVSG